MIDAEAIVKKLEAAALGGDVQAARTLLERALPVYRATAEPVMVDGIRCADSLTDKARAVLEAVAQGKVPPDIGAQLVTAIGTVARVAEVDELLRRIAREQRCALVIASSEFEELIGLADVIHVMRLGRLVATLPGATATYHDVLHEALP